MKHIPEFYDDDDEISRFMPREDFASVKEQREGAHKQELLLLCNFNEAYSLFK
jgi:hypothetical protein